MSVMGILRQRRVRVWQFCHPLLPPLRRFDGLGDSGSQSCTPRHQSPAEVGSGAPARPRAREKRIQESSLKPGLK
jgi:hypothetical protein